MKAADTISTNESSHTCMYRQLLTSWTMLESPTSLLTDCYTRCNLSDQITYRYKLNYHIYYVNPTARPEACEITLCNRLIIRTLPKTVISIWRIYIPHNVLWIASREFKRYKMKKKVNWKASFFHIWMFVYLKRFGQYGDRTHDIRVISTAL